MMHRHLPLFTGRSLGVPHSPSISLSAPLFDLLLFQSDLAVAVLPFGVEYPHSGDRLVLVVLKGGSGGEVEPLSGRGRGGKGE